MTRDPTDQNQDLGAGLRGPKVHVQHVESKRGEALKEDQDLMTKIRKPIAHDLRPSLVEPGVKNHRSMINNLKKAQYA